mgnify:CR=1 FL=1
MVIVVIVLPIHEFDLNNDMYLDVIIIAGGSKSSVAGLSRMNNRVAGLDQELSIFSNQRLLSIRQCDENVDNVGVGKSTHFLFNILLYVYVKSG